MVVGTLAHEHLEAGVHGLQRGKIVPDFLLGEGLRKGIDTLLEVLGGNVAVQVFQLLHSDLLQHGPDIGLCMRKIRKITHALLAD